MKIKPLFIFSLPRSGSTLLQRILSAHKEISTSSEPWLLLPLLYARKNYAVYAEYAHSVASEAINDFCRELPNGNDDYYHELNKFIIQLYTKAAKENTKYFLDKTPRYALIIKDIIDLFPEGKFVVLWRNPLAIISSIIETWYSGKWSLFPYKIDLYDGLSNLVSACQNCPERIFSLRYEDLVSAPDEILSRLLQFLDLSYNSSMLSNFTKIRLTGRFGDLAGTAQYNTLNKAPLEKWKATICNPFRKYWCRRYLNWIGKNRLEVMGYDLDNLATELSLIPVNLNSLAWDIAFSLRGILSCLFEPRLMNNKLRTLPDWHKVHIHI